MKTFIDPNFYVLSQEDWENANNLDRIEKFIEILSFMDKKQKQVSLKIKLFCIGISDNILGVIYESNPYINNPNMNFYHNLYVNDLFPKFSSKFSICSDVNCGDDINFESVSIPIETQFVDLLTKCQDCGHSSSIGILYNSTGHDSCKNKRIEIYFNNIDNSLNKLLSISNFFNIFKKTIYNSDDEANLNNNIIIIIESYIEFLKINSKADLEYPKCKIIATYNFWRNIRDSNFRGRDEKYLFRILSVISQIGCGKDMDIEAHKMKGCKVNYEGNNTPYWNAYVYRSGIDTNDERCSRIYYIKKPDKIILYEYEPDAH